jgi:hypothetical protein
VAPQGYWNYPKGTEQTPTHAQETNMERQTKLVGITSACIDCVALGTIEGEKCLHLEVADIAGESSRERDSVRLYVVSELLQRLFYAQVIVVVGVQVDLGIVFQLDVLDISVALPEGPDKP